MGFYLLRSRAGSSRLVPSLLLSLWQLLDRANNGFIARNVVFFSLIIDKRPIAATWNILYHLYIRDCDVELIRIQTRKLLRKSETGEAWLTSRYGVIINFLSEDTREQLRYFWTRYLEVSELGDNGLKSFEKPHRDAITATLGDLGEGPFVLNGFRGAGPHWAFACRILLLCFKAYWKTGVVAGNSHDVRDLGLGGHGRINPLLAISSSPDGSFAVHRDTDPLLGYHLASCFDEPCSQQQLIEKLAKHAQRQFKSWCRSFRQHIRSRTVHINVFCGDALRFCYALQSNCNPEQRRTKLTSAYTAQWRSTELVLKGLDNPHDRELFDVIETSNLMDHVGILNALPAISPLLARRVTSIMFTDTLLKLSEEKITTLSDLVGSDVTTISLILGITPVTHLVGFTTDSTAAEAARVLTTPNPDVDNSRCWTRIAWKVADFGDYVHAPTELPSSLVEFQEHQLAKFCLKLYLKMFGSENTAALAQSVRREVSTRTTSAPDHYTRLSFVCLLEVIKRRIQLDWKAFMKLLLEEINKDLHLFMGRNSFQELQVSLYLSGLLTDLPVALPPRRLPMTPYGPIRPPSSDKGLLGTEDPPSIVFVTMSVPRSSLKMFTKQDPKAAGTPEIQMNILNASVKMADHYFSIQCFFGKLSPHPEDETRCDVLPDPKGWKGKDDLIVTVPVPTWDLLVGTREGIRVILTVTLSAAGAQYAFRLGPEMEIFSCGLDDQRLRILSHPPGVSFNVRDPPVIISPQSSSLEEVCLATLNEKSETTTLRMYTPRILKTNKEIAITQDLPCMVGVKVEGLEDPEPIILRYPYPINAGCHQANFLAHGGMELVVSISPALVPGGYDHNPFSVCMQGSRTITPTIPHMKLDKLPIISADGNHECKEETLAWTLSTGEHRLVHEKAAPENTTALLELKKSICILYEIFLNTRGRLRIYELSRSPGMSTLLFISTLRHSGYQGSVFLEGFVVSLAGERLAPIQPLIDGMFETKEIVNSMLGPKEQLYWKKLLPALIESVRTTWSHGEECEYRKKKHIPLSAEPEDVPVCSCGEGEEIDTFPRCTHWELFAKYAKRLAIPPVSTVPFMESIAQDVSLQLDQLREHLPSVPPAASNAPVKREKCDQCGKLQEKLKNCQRCGKTKYCNHACQKAAWKGHKKQCKKG